ncbi:2-oxo acid dehydrogenase subunit E2 [Haloarchaeobius sp. HME9146]|uniref:2-oxo acid dehydrogenase subunit E2 n=1 Tax=Haloarchaeobius sp. HME9146 TaxID=2978732 RepID=UPI0021C1C93C|nr:2-oxo acid dehydrogenase subunit E2 [Haloarchaeobius sp. HME9146]MCT9095138.1 2-oxo acid dehydrogenase subunit E2 [Haloarchaeobius sp. HME9146]
MVREFKLPDVGEGVAEGELVSWLVEEGDTVTEDQPVAEVETDKALVEVPSPYNGTVKELRAEEGEMVPVGDVIMVYNVEGEDDLDAVGADEPAEAEAEGAAEADASAGAEAEAETPSGRVFAPPSARRLARELDVDINAVSGTGPSGRITEQDVRAHAESGGEPEPAEPASAEAGAAESASEPATADSGSSGGQAAQTIQREAADRDKTLAAPATRKLAEEKGVDLNAVPATEEREGQAFVTPEAVTEYAEAQQQAQQADVAALAAGEDRPREERVPYKGVRKAIGDQMQKSKYTAPHVTHHDEVDVTGLVEARKELKPHAEEKDIKLTYMPFAMKAVTAALKEYPKLNSSLDEENGEIVQKNYYNVGVAAATDAGLMVPVVKDADKKGMLQLSSEMNELVAKARDRSIALDEMQGGTFTITNVGVIGGEYATPIINYPEVGILALGAIKKKPRVVTDENGEDSIEIRHVMTLSLSFDHRIVDGAYAAQFTNKVKEYLSNPKLLLLE